MSQDYSLLTPSLDGVLTHEHLFYDGIRRPAEIRHVFDRPGRQEVKNDKDAARLETYFYDLYGVFLKKLSTFALVSSLRPDESVKLMALLQEMIRVKKLVTKSA